MYLTGYASNPGTVKTVPNYEFVCDINELVIEENGFDWVVRNTEPL